MHAVPSSELASATLADLNDRSENARSMETLSWVFHPGKNMIKESMR